MTSKARRTDFLAVTVLLATLTLGGILIRGSGFILSHRTWQTIVTFSSVSSWKRCLSSSLAW